jgi:hypothetical protein
VAFKSYANCTLLGHDRPEDTSITPWPDKTLVIWYGCFIASLNTHQRAAAKTVPFQLVVQLRGCAIRENVTTAETVLLVSATALQDSKQPQCFAFVVIKHSTHRYSTCLVAPVSL